MQFRRGILKFAMAGTVVLGVALSTATPASAADGDAVLNRDSAGRNGPMTISAGGFKANSPVELSSGNAFGSLKTADANGALVNATFTSPLTAGAYRVRLVGVDPSGAPRKTSAILTVLSNCEAANCNSLPQTGGIPLIWWGLGALGVGAVGVRLGRRVPIGKYSLLGKHSLLAVVVAGGVIAGVSAVPKAYAAATATINGHVQDQATDAALADMCVHAVSGTDFASARTNASGDYSLINLNPGTYKLNYFDCRSLNTYFNASNTDAVVADGAVVTAPVIEMTQGGNINGIVTDVTSGDGLDLVCVRLATSAAPDDFSGGCDAGTTATGVFFPDPLPAGTYGVLFHDLTGEHAIRYHGDANDFATDTPVTVAVGQSTPVNIALPAGATVSGTIVDDETNQPVSSLCVVDISNDVVTIATSFVGQDGKFEIVQVAPGNHKFRVGQCNLDAPDPDGYVTQYFSQKATLESADVVAITAGQDRTGVDARVSKTGVPAGQTTTTSPTTSTSTPTSTTSTTAPTSTTSTTVTVGTGSTTTTTTATLTRLTPTGTASTNTASAPVGGSVTATGSGFGPNTPVRAGLFSTPKIVGTATASAAGTVSISFLVPVGTDVGSHEIQLQGVNATGGAHVLSATLTVRAGTLSRTGSNAGDLALYAFAMILLGVSLFSVTYRRRIGSHFTR